MDIPREQDGSMDLISFEANLNMHLIRTQNPNEPVEVIVADDVEVSQIETFLDPNTCIIDSNRASEDYRLNISARL